MDINAIYGQRTSMNNSSSFMMQRSLQDATSTLKEAGDSLKIAASTLTRGIGTGIQTGIKTYNTLNPIIGSPSQAWIPGRGESYIQAPSAFRTFSNMLGGRPSMPIGRSIYGTGSSALGATVAGDASFRSSNTMLSWAKGATSVVGAASMFMKGPGVPLYVAAEIGGQMMSRAATRNKTASDIFRLSPGILPPALSGNIRGGFGEAQSIKIADSMSKMASGMDDMTINDLRAINLQGMKSGWYDKVKNVKDFTKEFRKLVGVVKDVSGILDVTVTESGQLVSKLRQLGLSGKREMMNTISGVQTLAERSSMSSMSLLTSSIAPAQQLQMQTGMSLAQGIQMVARNTTNAGLSYKMGNIGEVAYRRMGGAQGIGNMASSLMANVTNTPMGRALMSRMGTVDENGVFGLSENYKDFMKTDGASFSDIMSKNPTMTARQYMLNKENFGTVIKDNPKFMRRVLGGMIDKMGLDAETAPLFLTSHLGISANAAKSLITTMGMKDDPYMNEIVQEKQFRQRERTLSRERGSGWFSPITRGYDRFVEGGSDIFSKGGYKSAFLYDSFAKGLSEVSASSRGALLEGYDPKRKAGYSYDFKGDLSGALRRGRQALGQLRIGDGVDALDYYGYGREETGVDYKRLHRSMYDLQRTVGTLEIDSITSQDKFRYNNSRKRYLGMTQNLLGKTKEGRKDFFQKLGESDQRGLQYTLMKEKDVAEAMAKVQSVEEREKSAINRALDYGLDQSKIGTSTLFGSGFLGNTYKEELIEKSHELLSKVGKYTPEERIARSKFVEKWGKETQFLKDNKQYSLDASEANILLKGTETRRRGKGLYPMITDSEIILSTEKQIGAQTEGLERRYEKLTGGKYEYDDTRAPFVKEKGREDRLKELRSAVNVKEDEAKNRERESKYLSDRIGTLAKDMKVAVINADMIYHKGENPFKTND